MKSDNPNNSETESNVKIEQKESENWKSDSNLTDIISELIFRSETESNVKIEQKESEDCKSDSNLTDIISEDDDMCSLGSSDVQGNHFKIK